MIRFVDVGGGRFSFYDTINEKFITLQGESVWYVWDEIEELIPDDESYLDRLKCLCPEWVFIVYK